MEHIIVYDGSCSLCNGVVSFIHKRDPKLKFRLVSRQSEEGLRLIKATAIYGEIPDTILYFSSGKYFIRSGAVIRIMKDLGGIWRLGSVLIIIPAVIRDYFYNLIAKHRRRIGLADPFCPV